MALRQWISDKNNQCLISNRKGATATNNAFNFEIRIADSESTRSFTSIDTIVKYPSTPFSYQTSLLYNNDTKLPAGYTEGVDTLIVGSLSSNVFPANTAIYSICIIDHDTTEEERQKVIDYWKKEYPWLFPDQAWTVTGKTNDNEDRATIANITGNGNDLVLSNLGFIEGSGYNEEGEYAGYLVTDGVDDKILSANAFSTGEKWTIVGDWEFFKEESNKLAGIKTKNSFVVYNYLSGVFVYVYNPAGTLIRNVNHIKAVTSDGDVYVDFNSDVIQVPLGNLSAKNAILEIGNNGNNVFTKMAFKNLAFYNKVLTKDQCIKAYNYLQTLKAK